MSTTPQARSSKLARRNLSEDVAEHVRQLVFGGVLEPGSHVPQDEIAEELGVSRLPVREALIVLEAEGLVGLQPRRGAFVLPIHQRDIEDHYQIYGLVHGLAASRTAAAIDEGTVTELERLNERMHESDDAVVAELNWEFHRIINQLGGSRRLRAVLRTLSRNIPAKFFADVRGARELAIHGHSQIVEALRAGDPDAAARACHEHLRDEGSLVVYMMQERNLLVSEDGEGEQA